METSLKISLQPGKSWNCQPLTTRTVGLCLFRGDTCRTRRAIGGGSPKHIKLSRTTKPSSYQLPGRSTGHFRLSDSGSCLDSPCIAFQECRSLQGSNCQLYAPFKAEVQTHSESEAEDPRNDRIDEQRTGFVLGCSKLDSTHPHPTRRITERVLCVPSGRYRAGGWKFIDKSGQEIMITGC